jgi:hypothetical protein
MPDLEHLANTFEASPAILPPSKPLDLNSIRRWMRRDLSLDKLPHTPAVDGTGWKHWEPLLLRMADVIRSVSRDVLGEPFALASVRRYREGLETASGVRLFMLGALKYEMQGSRFGSEDWEADSLNGDLMIRLACMPEEEWLKGPASFRTKLGVAADSSSGAGIKAAVEEQQEPQPPRKDKGKARDCSEQDARLEKEKVGG